MKWVLLKEYNGDIIRRGALLKFKAGYPFEEQVVMMICENRTKSVEWPHSLVTITGHKAGISPFQLLPRDCLAEGALLGLSKIWLIDQWCHWVWVDGNPDEVYIRDQLEFEEFI